MSKKKRFDTFAKRIVASFAGLASILIISVSILTWSTKSLDEHTLKLAEIYIPSEQASARLLSGVHSSMAELKSWVILGEENFKEERRFTWEEEIKPSVETLERLSPKWNNPQWSKALKEIQHNLILLESEQSKLENIAELAADGRGDLDRANYILRNVVASNAKNILPPLKKLVDEQQRFLQIDLESLHKELKLFEILELILILIATVSACAFSIALLRSITLPISKACESAKKIASGDLNTQISISGAKEVEILGESLDNMRSTLLELNNKTIENTERFRGIVDTALDSIITIDIKGIITTVNPATERLFGYQKQELIGKNIRVLIESGIEAISIDSSNTGEQYLEVSEVVGRSREVQSKCKDNSDLPCLLSIGEIRTGEGIQFACILRDLSEIKKAQSKLEESNLFLTEQASAKSALSDLNDKMRGEHDLQSLSDIVIRFLAEYVDAQVGSIYVRMNKEESESLFLTGSYAFNRRKSLITEIKPGEGLISQAALERKTILISDVPENYISVNSSLGDAAPRNLLVVPLVFETRVEGVIELGTLTSFSDKQLELLEQMSAGIAIALHSAQTRLEMETLLEQTKMQSKELKEQQEELRASNEELEEQTEALKLSEKSLKEQREELRASNEELEEKTNLLEKQKADITLQQQSLEEAQKELEQKANKLRQANQYKSEFLANMSHELRTPLNSLLILAQNLSENRNGNLESKQIESLKIIHSGGVELLNLINDILDLSKVEAGKLDINLSPMSLQSLAEAVENQFRVIAESKNVNFAIEIDPELPKSIESDKDRIHQILKNFLSNAFKFTSDGSVKLEIHKKDFDSTSMDEGLKDLQLVEFVVTDTGIGIPEEQQESIFEAFQQADGSISRSFGGTGLGLTISLKLAQLLGGEIGMKSTKGKGSSFSLWVPAAAAENRTLSLLSNAEDSDLPENGRQKEQARAPSSADEGVSDQGLSNILLIEDDIPTQKAVSALLSKLPLEIHNANSGEAALELIKNKKFKCAILDLSLLDMSGFEFIEKLEREGELSGVPPMLVYTGRDLTREENQKLLAHAHDIVIKGASSPERLFDEVKLILDKESEADALPEEDKKNGLDSLLSGKRLLLVDDDIKNIYALSQSLCDRGMKITAANNGLNALEKLDSGDEFDLILMDIMMPVMDGYETMREIRAIRNLENLPIVALTAKAMAEDRSKCIEAGANDYVTKPVDIEKLLSTIRVWLH